MSKGRKQHAKAGDMNALSPLDQSFIGAYKKQKYKGKRVRAVGAGEMS